MREISLKKTPYALFSKRMTHIKQILLMESDLMGGDVKKVDEKTAYLIDSYLVFLYANWQGFVKKIVDEGNAWYIEKNNIAGNDREKRDEKIKKLLKYFGNPTTEHIDEIIRKAFGISFISKKWLYNGCSNERAIEMLDDLSTSRHQIVHEGKCKEEWNSERCFEYMNHLVKLAKITEDVIWDTVNQ